MSPEETFLLQRLGITLLEGIAWLTALCILYGAFALLFSISTAMIIRRGLKALPQRVMFTVTLLSFLLASMQLAAQLTSPSLLIRFGLIYNPDLPLQAKPALAGAKARHSNAIITWTAQLMPLISDAVVIWRAWVLFTDRLWFLILPVVLWLGTVATTFAYLAFDTIDEQPPGSLLIPDLLSSSIALSAATNAAATLLIAYILWAHRKVVVHNLGLGGKRRSQVQNVLTLLVESGLIYFILQIVTLILTFAPNSAGGKGTAQHMAGEIFFASYCMISGMYPTIVVVLVNLQRSFVDNYGLSSLSLPLSGAGAAAGGGVGGRGDMRPATLGHLSFAVPVFQSADDGESRSTATTPGRHAYTDTDAGTGTEKDEEAHGEKLAASGHVV
ncbi:hypothetical protein D9615_003132 [Tricholomella constricta]|uniref:Uncharacterized protein n=1 Tax=Tricholomella constricta TaxID=117010 RepID=A0A8H5M7S6_9AGAR|nr:hypothetical protein D9615_003132 [Tricholomella constricta]